MMLASKMARTTNPRQLALTALRTKQMGKNRAKILDLLDTLATMPNNYTQANFGAIYESVLGDTARRLDFTP